MGHRFTPKRRVKLRLANALRHRAGDVTIYVMQLYKDDMTSKVVDRLRDWGWTVVPDPELKNTILFSTADGEAAFLGMSPEQWDKTPIDDAEFVDTIPFDGTEYMRLKEEDPEAATLMWAEAMAEAPPLPEDDDE